MTRIDQLIQQMIAETSQQVLPTVYSATRLAGLQDLQSLTSSIAEQRAFAQQPAPAVPEGWKLVPERPTKGMRAAFHDSYERYEEGMGECPDSQWRAMLAAAPEYAAREGQSHE